MAAKKKKAAKRKKATKKAARRPTNPLTCKMEARAEMKTERGTVYLVRCGGKGKGTIDLGHVVADSEADAKKKARAFLRRLL